MEGEEQQVAGTFLNTLGKEALPFFSRSNQAVRNIEPGGSWEGKKEGARRVRG